MKEGEMYEYLRDNHYTGNFFGSSSMGSEYLSSKGYLVSCWLEYNE